MTQRIRNHLTFASVTSMLAIFVALGGTTYAAVTLATNSVGAAQIKKNGVAGQEIRKNAVRSGEVRNGSLRLADFAPGTIAPGPTGPQGSAGIQGIAGRFTSVTVQHTTAEADLADGGEMSIDAFCPEGQVGINGGWLGDAENPEATIHGSSRPVIAPTNTGAPVDDGTLSGWRTTVVNQPGGATTGIRPQVWVVCATPNSG